MSGLLHGRFRMPNSRCAYLFFTLVAWLVLAPFVGETLANEVIEGVLNLTILVAAVFAVSRSRLVLGVSLALALLLAILWYTSVLTSGWGDDALAGFFLVVFYAYVLFQLLRYVLRAEVVTTDKLYGAASAYLMLAMLWAGFYGLIQYFFPGAFAYLNTPMRLSRSELLYFSFITMTTAGYGDIIPVLPQSRSFAMLQACAGVLYTAILIARLASELPSSVKKP